MSRHKYAVYVLIENVKKIIEYVIVEEFYFKGQSILIYDSTEEGIQIITHIYPNNVLFAIVGDMKDKDRPKLKLAGVD